LSAECAGIEEKRRWRCAAGHEWEATPHNIQQRGSWCPECAGNKQKTLADMYALAAAKGGEFISAKYAGRHKKHLWRCARDHEWQATPGSIRQGSWCPECAGKRPKTLADMHALAASRGGKFLSGECLGVDAKHRWRCATGHEWEATPDSVRQGRWCPTCAGNKPKVLADMHALAAQRGGEFLSAEYLGMGVKHRWRCAAGHEWQAVPSSIQRGSWCPVCAREAAWRTRRATVSA